MLPVLVSGGQAAAGKAGRVILLSVRNSKHRVMGGHEEKMHS